MNREQVVDWYATLAPRDQRVLHLGALAVVLIVLAGVFLPLHRAVQDAKAQLQSRQEDLEWMKRVKPTLIAAGPGSAANAAHESLVVVVDRSARESGLATALTATQVLGNGALSAQLERANFNNLTAWISRLSSQSGVRVEAASFSTGNSPGIVNATMQLHLR